MAEGIEGVRSAIVRDFGPIEITEGHDFNTKDAVLSFTSEGRSFAVEVTNEYDNDYASGQIRVDLRRLGVILRASKDGKAIVMRSGVSLRPAA
jgi:hypothetical protein